MLATVEPTEAQARAGNYKKGHVVVHGLPITIETARGKMRRGIGADGEPWEVRMPASYGYFKRSEGADGDHVDCYVGPHLKAPKVFVIDQKDSDTGKFDEHKCLIGFGSKEQALAIYRRGFSDGRGQDRIGNVKTMAVDEFKHWLANEDTTKALKRAAGGRVGYAEGGEAGDWQAVDDWASPDAPAAPAAKASGHNDSWLAPITDIPAQVYKAGSEALSSVNENLNPLSEAATARRARGEPPSLMNTGKGLASILAVPAALPMGVARSVVGHPYSWLMPKAKPEEQERLRKAGISESMIPGRTTAENFEKATGDVDTAMSAAAPRGFSPAGARAATLPPAPTITPRDEIAQAAERLGVEVPIAGATDSLVAQRMGAAAKEIPIVGDPLVKASKRSIEGLGEAAENTAAQYGSGNVLTAGDTAKTALSDWVTGKSKAVTSRLYDRVDNMVNPSATRPLHETQAGVSDILAGRIASGENSLGKAVDVVADAITRPGGLTYHGTKDLRTRIGSYLDGSIIPEPGTSMPELKKLYGTLTKDLRGVVLDHGGPDALAAFDKANRVAEMVARRRESLAKIIGRDASVSAEGVVDRLAQMASTKSTANIERLGEARKAIGPQGWDEVASAVISRVGRDPSGNFSPDRFVTAYGKMSDEGKKALFGSTGRTDLVQSLNDIATISQRAKQIAQYGNPSGTGRVASLMAGAGALWAEPLTAASTLLGGNIMARALARPVTAKSVANWTKAYNRAVLQATPPAQNALRLASANLARSLGQFGYSPAAVMERLQGPVPVRADQQEE